MGGTDNLRDSLNLIITMVVIIVLIGVVFIWVYNFIAVSDDKLFDDNNKFIDSTLADPNVEGNLKDTYNNQNKLNEISLNLMSWFGGLKGIVIIAFLFLFLISLVLKNRKLILENMKNMFN